MPRHSISVLFIYLLMTAKRNSDIFLSTYTQTHTHTHTHTNRNYCGEKKKKEKEGENKEKKKKMKTSAQGHNMSSPHSSHAHTLVIGTDPEVTQQSHQHILTHRVVSHKEKKKGRQRTETKSRKKKRKREA